MTALLMPAVQRVWLTAKTTETQNDLRQIALAYKNFTASSPDKRGPKTQQEISPFYENSNRINAALDANQITVIWGIPNKDFKSYDLLAYETDADRAGNRLVAMCDASVCVMGEQGFKLALSGTGI